MLSKFSVPKRRKQNKSNFWMVNLCNGGIKDFGVMGNYTFEHLNSINLKHYGQTCLKDHLCQTTNAKSVEANSRSIVTI